MHISLPPIPNNSFRVVSVGIPLNIDSHSPVHFQLQTDLILHSWPSCILAPILALQLQFLQSSLQICKLRRKTLRLDLQIVGRLCDTELLCVESRNLRGMGGGRVRREGFEVVVIEGVESS